MSVSSNGSVFFGLTMIGKHFHNNLCPTYLSRFYYDTMFYEHNYEGLQFYPVMHLNLRTPYNNNYLSHTTTTEHSTQITYTIHSKHLLLTYTQAQHCGLISRGWRSRIINHPAWLSQPAARAGTDSINYVALDCPIVRTHNLLGGINQLAEQNATVAFKWCWDLFSLMANRGLGVDALRWWRKKYGWRQCALVNSHVLLIIFPRVPQWDHKEGKLNSRLFFLSFNYNNKLLTLNWAFRLIN